MRKFDSVPQFCITILLFSLLSTRVVAAAGIIDSIVWVGDVSVTHKSLELTQLNVSNTTNFTSSPTFFTLNLSFTAAFKSAFLSINYDAALDDYSEKRINSAQANREELYRYSRKDSNITTGYNLNKSFSVFGGYLLGQTDIEYTLIEQPSGSMQQGFDESKEDGLFIGVNYRIPVMKTSNLNVNVGYAALSGQYHYLASNAVGTFEGTINGDTSGFSLGAKYTHLISRAFYFYFGIKLNQYNFESDSGIFNTEENFTIISSGITRYFL